MLAAAVVFLFMDSPVQHSGRPRPTCLFHTQNWATSRDVNDDWPLLSCYVFMASVKGIIIITISSWPSEFIAAAKVPLRAMNFYLLTLKEREWAKSILPPSKLSESLNPALKGWKWQCFDLRSCLMHLFLRLLKRELISSHSSGISVLVDTCPKKMSHEQGGAFARAIEMTDNFNVFQLFLKNSLR